MNKIITIAMMLALTAGFAAADFTAVGSSGETNTKTILENIYGTALTGANWAGLSYTGGGLTITRVDDFVSVAGGRTPGADLNVVTGGPGMPVTDQIWSDGFTRASAEARFAGYNQKFGYKDGPVGGSFIKLFDVAGNKFNVSGGGSVDLTGHIFRWARDGQNGVQSSLETENDNGSDNMITYHVSGLNDGFNTFVLFFEDKDIPGADADYNDLVVEIKAVPVPGAILLGAIGLTTVGVIRRRKMA